MSTPAAGTLYAALAFLLWGFAPLYWRLLGEYPARLLICHRVLWSLPTALLLVALLRRGGALRATIRNRQTLLRLWLAGFLVGLNWFVFVHAIEVRRVLDVSLGYYVTPLVNILLGAVVLGERLRPAQRVAILLATSGVVLRTVEHGALPWISVVLAVSFGLYGLLKKTVQSGAIVGLSVELLPLVPVAGVMLLLDTSPVPGFWEASPGTRALLGLVGPVTVVPLLLFAAGAKRVAMATVGMLQFIAPTVQFVLATAAFGEPFATEQLLAFVLVWCALAIYLWDARQGRRARVPVLR